MTTVSDTSPVHYLVLIGQAELLPKLFGDILIPGPVAVEMRHPRAPGAVREGRNSDLTVLTTFSVLELAAIRNLIDFEEVLAALAQTTFRMPPDDVVNEYLRRNTERKLA